MFALIHLFKQPSALFLFFSATFLSFLLFPFSVSDPLYSFHSLSSFVIIYVWRAVINKDKHSSMRLCVCVWEMDASSLIALLASPPLLTPLHIQLQAFFPPPPIPPSRPPARKAASGPSQARTEASLWGCRGRRCWRMRTRDPGQATDPRPWSGLPASQLKGLRGWAQHQGKRGSGGRRSQQW